MVAAWTVIIAAVAWVGFAYAGYPLLLGLLARLSPRPVRRGDAAPSLAVVIAVHNGAKLLARKLEDTLALSYPRPFEVIVASDGSTDATDAIARALAARGVRLVRNETRQGKEAAQAAAIAKAGAEVLVFTDLSAVLSPDALRAIVRPFADPTVGSVSSEDRVANEGGEGTYVRMEMALRRWESEATSLVGLSGSFFAARRELCDPWPPDLASDFRTALETARRGLRAVSEPAATASFAAIENPASEWPRKVRTVRRGIAVLSAYRGLLHPRHGRVAFSLWGHKVARFTAPFALALLLAASALAAPHDRLAALLLVAQLAGYALGILALARAERGSMGSGAADRLLPAGERLDARRVAPPLERRASRGLGAHQTLMAAALRRWPPGGEAFGPAALWVAARARDPEGELRAALRARLAGAEVTLHASGREAMRVAMAFLAKQRARDEILVPAYTCFSVPASAVAAGLRVRLVDVTLEGHVDPACLETLPLERAAALVVSNLFGVPEPVGGLRERLAEAGVALIDDAAQALGARTPEGPVGARGDLGILSFGRGKPLSALGGGAIVWSEPRGLEAGRADPRRGAALAKALAYDVALQPAVFRWLAAIPALHIGETPFEPGFPRGPIDGASLCLAAAAVRRFEQQGLLRARRAEALGQEIAATSAFTPVRADARSVGVYPRLALIAPRAAARDARARGVARPRRDRHVSLFARPRARAPAPPRRRARVSGGA